MLFSVLEWVAAVVEECLRLVHEILVELLDVLHAGLKVAVGHDVARPVQIAELAAQACILLGDATAGHVDEVAAVIIQVVIEVTGISLFKPVDDGGVGLVVWPF